MFILCSKNICWISSEPGKSKGTNTEATTVVPAVVAVEGVRRNLVLAYGVLVLQPGIEPVSFTLEGWNFHHWTTKEVPRESVIKIFPIFFTFFPPHKTCPWVIMKLVPSLFSFLVVRPLGFTSPRFFRVLIVMEESRWMHFLKTSVPCKMSPARRKKCIIQDVELLMMTFQAPLKGRLGLVWTLPTFLPITSCL